MAGLKAFQRVQYGFESTAGTAVAAGKQWRGAGSMIDDQRTIVHPEELTSIATPTTRMYTPRLLAALSMAATPATFEQLPVILSAGIKKVEAGVADGGGSGYVYAFPMPTTALNTISSLTLESGDNQAAEEMEYSFVTDFTLQASAGEAIMMSANWNGRQAAPSTFTGAATIGTVEEILASKGAVYIDDGGGTIGTTQLSQSILSMSLSVTTGWKPKWFIDGGQLYFSRNYYDIGSVAMELSLTFEHDATGVAAKADWRAETEKLIRLTFTGSDLGTAGAYDYKTLQIDMTGQYTRFDPLSDQEGNSIYQATFRGAYSPTDALAPLTITVVNEASAL